jgi:hypothetical protein
MDEKADDLGVSAISCDARRSPARPGERRSAAARPTSEANRFSQSMEVFMTVRSLTHVALVAALALAPMTSVVLAADNSVKVLKPASPTPELKLKGNATAPDVHCSTVPSQTLQPCTGDFKAWCELVGGTYGETANPDVEACFHRNEW